MQANYPERVTQNGAIDVGVFDHQLIYCTKKISRIKRGSHKQIKFRSFKHYTVDLFEQELSSLSFPNKKRAFFQNNWLNLVSLKIYGRF